MRGGVADFFNFITLLLSLWGFLSSSFSNVVVSFSQLSYDFYLFARRATEKKRRVVAESFEFLSPSFWLLIWVVVLCVISPFSPPYIFKM